MITFIFFTFRSSHSEIPDLIEVKDEFGWTTLHMLRNASDGFFQKISWNLERLRFLRGIFRFTQSVRVTSKE
jgi:hypothetical protein